MKLWIAGCALVALVACKDDKSNGEAKAAAPPEKAGSEQVEAPVAADERAAIGKPAPAFELTAVGGEKVSLADHKGKVVVLEWFNPGCPFVKFAHNDGGPLKEAARKWAEKDVVWIAINSGAKGKQGHGEEANKEAKEQWSMDHPVLLDEDGRVGKVYGAQRTPHVYVIDATGNLAYHGAVDNSGGAPPDAEVKYLNYLEQAIEAVIAGKTPETTETKPWGCSVKYAD